MVELTSAQKRVLDFIQGEVHGGRPVPTLREIAAKFGFRGHRAAACHLEALKRKGFLESETGKARSLRVTSPLAKLRRRLADIPLYGSIPAGFASDREQQPDGCLSVDIASIGFKPTRNTFALRVAGDSMIGQHICDGDIAVFEHGAEPRSGQIVAALIDRKSTLKTFLVKNGKPFLKAENPQYPDLIPSEELVIQGVFRALIRKAKECGSM
jgi:repressor LexA